MKHKLINNYRQYIFVKVLDILLPFPYLNYSKLRLFHFFIRAGQGRTAGMTFVKNGHVREKIPVGISG